MMAKVYSRLLLIVLLISTFPAHADLTSGLQSHWKFDETSGTTAVDSVGGLNGTLTVFQASPWSASPNSKIDGALEWNNTNGTRVLVGDYYNFTGNANFTLSAWVYRLNTTGATTSGVISKNIDPGTGKQGWGISICNGCGTANRGFVCERYINGGNANALDLSGDVPLNQWVHVACTYNGTTIRLYRDGVQVDTGTSTGAILGNTTDLVIGNNSNNNTGMRGRIDEVRIYNRALSAAEVYALANPCTSAEGGIMKYFTDTNDKRVRYCNTKYWESTTSRSAGSACTTAGLFDFDTTNNNFRFCNGTSYYPMGPTGAGGTGCSSPTGAKGAMVYDSTTTYFKYCDGTSWVNDGT